MWLHVDGAMSGIAALAPEHRWVNEGMEYADSYCTNPHKWMGVNFDCDLYWTADRTALLGALSILPEYLRSAAAETGAAIDYRDWQVPLGRRFRALKLWLTIRARDVAAFQTMIRRHVELTQRLADARAADDRFEIVAPHPLNLLCIRLRPATTPTDRLIERANATGPVLFTRTVLDGRRRSASRSAPGRPSAVTSPRPGIPASRDRCVRGGLRAALRRSTSMVAVAPQIVSSSSSKKCSSRSVGARPHRSDRYVSGRTSSASGSQKTRSTSGLAGWSRPARPAGRRPGRCSSADRGVEVLELAHDLDDGGIEPDLLPRLAPVPPSIGVSPGSTRPPGS